MKSSPKTLLWLIHEGHMSGANLALLEYFEVLQHMGFELCVVSPSKGACVDELSKKKIPVHIVPFYPWTRQKGEGFFVNKWYKRLSRNTYACLQITKIAKTADAVCTNTICTQLGMISARLSRKKHFLFVHEFGEEDHGFQLAIPSPKAYHLFYNYSEEVVLNSKAVKAKWEHLVGEKNKLSILYNCVNDFKSPTNDSVFSKPILPKFLMLGQITEGKGHKVAIKAIASIADQHKDIELHIIGSKVDKAYYKELQGLIKNSKAKIFLKPPVANPFLIFKEYTALLMCSRKEAFGRVTVEALKSGLPVIGINSGGTSEIVEHNFNGFLIDSEQKKDVAYYLAKMIDMNPKTYQEMAANALQIKNKFNKEVSKSQFEHIFKTLY